MNIHLGLKKQALTVVFCFIICLAHIATGAVLAWDFLIASFSSIVE
jgi:hypothetical protein